MLSFFYFSPCFLLSGNVSDWHWSSYCKLSDDKDNNNNDNIRRFSLFRTPWRQLSRFFATQCCVLSLLNSLRFCMPLAANIEVLGSLHWAAGVSREHLDCIIYGSRGGVHCEIPGTWYLVPGSYTTYNICDARTITYLRCCDASSFASFQESLEGSARCIGTICQARKVNDNNKQQQQQRDRWKRIKFRKRPMMAIRTTTKKMSANVVGHCDVVVVTINPYHQRNSGEVVYSTVHIINVEVYYYWWYRCRRSRGRAHTINI